jgi:hypothetical protein
MSFRATTLWRLFLVVFLVATGAERAAFAQVANAPINFASRDAMTVSFVAPPTLSSGDSSSGGSAAGDTAQWLKVEFHYNTTAIVTTKYLDTVQFKIWIEGLDSEAINKSQASGKGVAVALTGTVTYVNVPVGKDLYGVFYVHPNTLARYSGERGAEDFDRKFNMHLEASVGGAVVDNIDRRPDPAGLTWFQALRATPGMVYRQDQSPFALSDVSRYPAIKLPPDASQ